MSRSKCPHLECFRDDTSAFSPIPSFGSHHPSIDDIQYHSRSPSRRAMNLVVPFPIRATFPIANQNPHLSRLSWVPQSMLLVLFNCHYSSCRLVREEFWLLAHPLGGRRCSVFRRSIIPPFGHWSSITSPTLHYCYVRHNLIPKMLYLTIR